MSANTNTEDTEGMVNLVALVMASNDQATYVRDQLHEAALRDVVRLCDRLIELDEILACATVIDRQTESRLWKVDLRDAYPTKEHALRMIGRL